MYGYNIRRAPFAPAPLTATQQLEINSRVRVAGITQPGLGIGTSVTQITSFATGVTANAACGTITTVSAGFTANTFTSFVVSNNQVLPTDIVLLTPQTAQIVAIPNATTTGQFTLNIDPLVTATSALVINFQVIKSVNS